MVSPELSREDQEAIRRGVAEPAIVLQEALQRLFEQAQLSHAAIEKHTVETLSYLVASGRMRLRVVFMQGGMYHKKIWLFRSGEDWLAVHGSGNATERGLLMNGEQMSVDRAWADGKQSKERVTIFLRQWEARWNNHHPSSLTVEAEQALRVLRDDGITIPPTVVDFWEAWCHDSDAGLEPPLPPGRRLAPVQQRLSIPKNLVWRSGRFAHQGPAVDALLKNNGGILSMATGGGKTRTALIAVTEFQMDSDRHLCVIVLAPTRPLIRQWAEDIREFGIEPVVLSGMGMTHRQAELERMAVAFATLRPRTEVLLLTHSLFTKAASSDRMWIENLSTSVDRILIADEVHRLGSPIFLKRLPTFFDRRIGLSATPVRQYDPDGTDKLFDFFGGEPVFDFSLRDAIRAGCLVPYSYHPHVICFTSDEMDIYEDLTEQLVKAGFQIDDDGRTVGMTKCIDHLLRQRRALVEQADEKLARLEYELSRMRTSSISKTLIYASAKPVVPGKSRQITAVNRILQELDIISHQFTAAETQSKQSQSILDRFESGDYQVLTSMRVLDEGVNIPQTDTAFLLASSTVEREWVQRRGRILRTAPGKGIAHLYDFVVVPPYIETAASKSLLRSELRRVAAFADLAENEFDTGGPNDLIRKLERKIW